MTDVVPIPNPPTVPPYPALGSPNFNAEAYAYGSAMPSVVAGILAMAQAGYTNGVAANERATAASGAAGTATQQADAAMGYRNQANAAASTATTRRDEAAGWAAAADASRIEAARLNLGAKAAPPSTDNQGQALRTGANYYDTSLNKLRVWDGSGWTDGISAVAGVKSLNGQGGDLVRTTLASYGIEDFKVQVSGDADLNSLTTPGVYRFTGSATNAPPGVTNSVVIVARGADTGSHTVVDYLTGAQQTRGFLVQGGGAIAWTPWRRGAITNPAAVPVSGSTLDLRQGSYFKDTVSDNKTYTFANQVAGTSFWLEVTHTGGAISFPATVFAGAAPSLTVNRRHLFHFQLPSLENAWLCMPYANFPL